MVNKWNDKVTADDAEFVEKVAPALAEEAWQASFDPTCTAKQLSVPLRKVLRRSRNLASARKSRKRSKEAIDQMENAIARLSSRCKALEGELECAHTTITELTQVALASGSFCAS
jgi:hypothetical protein